MQPQPGTAAAAAAANWQHMRAQAPAVQAAGTGAGNVPGGGRRAGDQDDGFWETPSRTSGRAASPPGVMAAGRGGAGAGQQGQRGVAGNGKATAAFGG